MGVYIKGMEMPSGCASCDFANYLRDGEPYCRRLMRRVPAARRLPDCPLVPVPPHGRLIDADAFAAEMKKRQEEAGKWLREAKDRETAVRADAVLSFLCEVKLTLDAATTVIPAEEAVT